MKKFVQSKLFVILTPIVVFVLGAVAGALLGFQPESEGNAGGYVSYIDAQFNVETAIGYWLLALVLAIITLLICLAVRKLYSSEEKTTL